MARSYNVPNGAAWGPAAGSTSVKHPPGEGGQDIPATLLVLIGAVAITVLVPIVSAATSSLRTFPDGGVPEPVFTVTCPTTAPVTDVVVTGLSASVTVYAPPGPDGILLIVIDTCMINGARFPVDGGKRSVAEKVIPFGLFN